MLNDKQESKKSKHTFNILSLHSLLIRHYGEVVNLVQIEDLKSIDSHIMLIDSISLETYRVTPIDSLVKRADPGEVLQLDSVVLLGSVSWELGEGREFLVKIPHRNGPQGRLRVTNRESSHEQMVGEKRVGAENCHAFDCHCRYMSCCLLDVR